MSSSVCERLLPNGFDSFGRKKVKVFTTSHTGVYQPVVCPDPTKGIARKQNQRPSTCLCVVVLLVSVAINVALVSWYMYIRLNGNTNAEVQFDADMSNSICVRCDSLHLPEPDNSPLISKVKVIDLGQKSSLCCLQHSEHLQTLLNLVVGEYYHYSQSATGTEAFSLRPNNSAHLYLDVHRNKANHRLTWVVDTGFGTAHTTGGVRYSNGTLRVHQDGVYFLYSHVTISPDNITDGLDIVHCVQRYNPHLPQTGNQLLLISKMSLNNHERRTSFLAANLKLRRHDEIFVEFSDPSLVYNFSPASYFGLHRL
ncbi:tumor necrosis factor ligand superfamily member 11-like [Haliotis rufescens]|uniref:tumor necrosis factor ligand superfamily member 11-like n=1 Tax=Haliotis rufescens TaxID=6454 RepID=UPI001EB092BD|nr:tumor necrosis factor ligand superfamily member 11-like [Haliotis rufescens]